MKLVRVRIDGNMDEVSIDKGKNIVKNLEKIAISKGSTQLKKLYEWNLSNKKYEAYGWFDGEAGFENKHDLIPNGNSEFLEEESSEILLFGDIFITCMENKKYINLDISEYGEVFGLLCEGYDSCHSSEEELSEEEEVLTEDEEFIVDDDEEIITDSSYSTEEELDIDENDYTSDEVSDE